MTTASEAKKKGARRRMKQMQGLLLLSRLDEAARRHASSGRAKPQRVTVVLQPQLLELSYSALADQDMVHPLGRIDLREAKLEQVPDGFVIYEAGQGARKKFKLQDKDKATTDAWFFAVYTAITEYERLPISASEDVGHKFSAVLTSSLRDEHTDVVEFELSCQLVLPARPIDKPSIKWKTWKTFAELQSFDEYEKPFPLLSGPRAACIVRQSYDTDWLPARPKARLIFRRNAKKSLQDLKEQQLALYVEQVFQMPEISVEPVLVEKVKRFLGFDSFFEITALPVDESDGAVEEAPVCEETPVSDEPVLTVEASKFDEAPEASSASEPPYSSGGSEPPHSSGGSEPPHSGGILESPHFSEAQEMITQPTSDPVNYQPQVPAIQYSNTVPTSSPPALLRRTSSATLEDSGEEFVEVVPVTDPKVAKKLHKQIIQTVRELVSYDEERVQDFQDQTKDFGREKTSAMEYCAFLLGAVGAQECCKLIPEMAKLLPDNVKRDELLQARAAIWRRTHRRNRRRSKQFSESVVLQKQKEEQHQVESVHSRMRPKSDSLGALNYSSEPVQLPQIPVRNSMVERPTPTIDADIHNHASNNGAVSAPVRRGGLADPRRHLNRRASFNSMFGEAVPPDPIKEEENPAEKDSDDDSDSDDSLLDHPRVTNQELTPIERKQSLNGTAWTRPSDLRRQNPSFMDEDDEDDSTEDDEVNRRARRSRRSRHRHQSGSSNKSLDKQRTVKERPSSRGGLTRSGSSQLSSSFIESDEEPSGAEGEDSHTRFRRSQRRASRKFDEEAKSGPAFEEENPVLARLKKQGAVNFMMQIH